MNTNLLVLHENISFPGNLGRWHDFMVRWRWLCCGRKVRLKVLSIRFTSGVLHVFLYGGDSQKHTVAPLVGVYNDENNVHTTTHAKTSVPQY